MSAPALAWRRGWCASQLSEPPSDDEFQTACLTERVALLQVLVDLVTNPRTCAPAADDPLWICCRSSTESRG